MSALLSVVRVKEIASIFLLAFAATFLTACGGGGGSDAPPATGSGSGSGGGSSPAVIAPVITTQPLSQTVNDGAAVRFSSGASGTAPFSTQWKKNGADIPGAVTAFLDIAAVSFSDNGAQFSATVSNSAGSVTTAPATLTVLAVAPTIVTSPLPQTVVAGNSATFSVIASGTGPLTLQWRRNGAVIPGATSASYTTPITAPVDNGSVFSVTVSNAQGSVVSGSTLLEVTPVPNAVSIVTHPQSVVLTEGGVATFSVAASGSGPFTYQWQQNGVPIRGGYEATLKIAPATMFDNASQISVAVSNTLGTSTSNIANLTVNPGAISLLLGSIGGWGNIDGPAGLAHFASVCGLSTDNAGNHFVSDGANQNIRKIDATGVVSTLAGLAYQSGYSDSTGLNARFNGPTSLTVDTAGNIYVIDSHNDSIRKITPAGVVTTLAGSAGNPGAVNGTGVSAQFNFFKTSAFGCNSQVSGIAIDANSNIYVADSHNHAIRKITPSGTVTTFAGVMGQAGYVDGPAVVARFDTPTGIAIDSAQNLHVIDHSLKLRKISTAGEVSSLPGNVPVVDGPVFVDNSGAIFLAGPLILYQYQSGIFTARAGSNNFASVNGVGSSASFKNITAIAPSNSGGLLIGEEVGIRLVNAYGQVSTFAGNLGFEGGYANGPAATARINSVKDAATDSSGNIYFTDWGTVRMISPSGVVSTISGISEPGTADGPAADARFNLPQGIARSSSGSLYVSDSASHTIRKIAPNGDVSTIAGLASNSGFADGNSSASRLNNPGGLAVDASDNVYFVDRGNYVVRRISASGTVSTIAGLGGTIGAADGTGSSARFTDLHDIVIDSAGDLYVTDNYSVRKITPAGVVTTFAGSLSLFGAADGNGAGARFVYIKGITIDSNDNLYVVDGGNTGRIRKITPAAQVTTVAGTSGSWGIQLGALPGSFDTTQVITVIPSGSGTQLAVSNGLSLLRVSLP